MSVEVRWDTESLRRLAWDSRSAPARYAERQAGRVRAAAAQRAPRDTGHLARSIRVEGPVRGRDGLAWDVVAPVPYAQWIIRGRRRDPRVRRPVVAYAGPRPFMAEALRQVFG